MVLSTDWLQCESRYSPVVGRAQVLFPLEMFMRCRCGQTGLTTRAAFGNSASKFCLDRVTVVCEGMGLSPPP